MRRTIPAIAACLLAAGCATTSRPAATTAPKAPASSTKPTAAASTPAAPATPASTAAGAGAAATMAWGTRAYTVGSAHPFQASATPGAPLEITPTSVVYASHAPAETPASGMFAVVVAKEAAPMAAAVATAPATGGGWAWIAPDGQATTTMGGNANMVVLTGLNGDVAPAGAYVMTTVVFDVPPAAKGGTLQYTDGGGVVFRWKVPAATTGPQVAQVDKALAG